MCNYYVWPRYLSTWCFLTVYSRPNSTWQWHHVPILFQIHERRQHQRSNLVPYKQKKHWYTWMWQKLHRNNAYNSFLGRDNCVDSWAYWNDRRSWIIPYIPPIKVLSCEVDPAMGYDETRWSTRFVSQYARLRTSNELVRSEYITRRGFFLSKDAFSRQKPPLLRHKLGSPNVLRAPRGHNDKVWRTHSTLPCNHPLAGSSDLQGRRA